jgi:preprotein translocase subunit SecG
MVVFFTIIHVLLCVFMIFVILLQPGKDAGMGAALGGGAATSAFGGRGAVTVPEQADRGLRGAVLPDLAGLSFVGVRELGDQQPAAKPAPARRCPAPRRARRRGRRLRRTVDAEGE